MPINQDERWNKVASPELDTQNKRPLTVRRRRGSAFG